MKKVILPPQRPLTPHERVILDALYFQRRPLTTKEVAEIANMAWATAKRNLYLLEQAGYVQKKTPRSNKTLWILKS